MYSNLNGICQNKIIVIPRSKLELFEMKRSLKKYNATKLKIFTDYKRANETHFWSKAAENWWNIKNASQWLVPTYKVPRPEVYGVYHGPFREPISKHLTNCKDHLKFKKWVACDGNKKLTNSLDDHSCICIGTYVNISPIVSA